MNDDGWVFPRKISLLQTWFLSRSLRGALRRTIITSKVAKSKGKAVAAKWIKRGVTTEDMTVMFLRNGYVFGNWRSFRHFVAKAQSSKWLICSLSKFEQCAFFTMLLWNETWLQWSKGPVYSAKHTCQSDTEINRLGRRLHTKRAKEDASPFVIELNW